MKVNIVNIGCFKNLVDCEYLIWQLKANGIEVTFGTDDLEKFELAIINTCGFISDAENSTTELICRYAERKRQARIRELWIMGCYGQKMGDVLRSIIPEIDKVYGNFNWHQIVNDICGQSWNDVNNRVLTTPGHYAFVKISEGCNMKCTYCIKPVLNGPMTSRRIEDILDECRLLVKNGVREVEIVAQISSAYGIDIYHENRIAELINRIADIPGIDWIRIHYAYPGGFPMNLLTVIRERTNVCKYLDMAIQHCNEKILQRMGRPMKKSQIENLLSTIRAEVPGIAIRTTVMTGFPGETDNDYQELREFILNQRFDRMGVFSYSHESKSYSGNHYTDDVPESLKRRRALELMNIQREIYKESNTALIGHPLKVIIDSKNHDGSYWARPESSTPMADPKVKIITNDNLVIGSFQTVIPTVVYDKDFEARI